jgi:hypothetical protein
VPAKRAAVTIALGLALAASAGCRAPGAASDVPRDAASARPAPVAVPAAPAAVAAPAKNANTYWALVEPHFERVSIYDGPDAFLREYAATPDRARHLLAAHWCVSEVGDGGFVQFFSNATGVLAPEAVLGLEAIGLGDAAAVVRDAMKVFGARYPRDMTARRKRVAALVKGRGAPGPFAAADARLSELLRQHEGGFDAAAAAYARAGGAAIDASTFDRR